MKQLECSSKIYVQTERFLLIEEEDAKRKEFDMKEKMEHYKSLYETYRKQAGKEEDLEELRKKLTRDFDRKARRLDREKKKFKRRYKRVPIENSIRFDLCKMVRKVKRRLETFKKMKMKLENWKKREKLA